MVTMTFLLWVAGLLVFTAFAASGRTVLESVGIENRRASKDTIAPRGIIWTGYT